MPGGYGQGHTVANELAACLFGWWPMLIYSERKVLLAGCWWLIYSERKDIAGWWLISQTNRLLINFQTWRESHNLPFPGPHRFL
jgi:hypothetical protein